MNNYQYKHKQTRATSNLKYLLVLDFEATCEKDDENYPNEIIEFPIVLVNLQTLQIEDEFHQYVKPTINPKLSDFCKDFTGIQQSWVDQAQPINQVLKDAEAWLVGHNLLRAVDQNQNNNSAHIEYEMVEPFGFGTDGPWDFEKFLAVECKRFNIPVPFYYVSKMFADFLKTKRMNVKRMLQKLGMQFIGNPHSGIDDTRNIAMIAVNLAKKGCLIEVNAQVKI